MSEIIVIGGGAAGMMAAITAARRGAGVTLLEPNERLGKKLNITGKGRCNVTNDCDQETLMANIPGNGRFLYSALTRFTPQDAMAFFEALGVPLKVERGNRVFPVSDRSFDISGALERELRRLRVRILRERAAEITAEDGPSPACKPTGSTIRRTRWCWLPAACPIRAPAPPATATPWRRRWGTPSCRPEARWCRWRAAMPTAPPCRA